MELEDLYKNKSSIQSAVETELSEKFTTFGKEIRAVLVDEPSPSHSIQEAYNQVIASKRLMEAAQNEAEADRIRLVGKAQAEAQSKKLQGEGIAQMRREIANGMKDSMEAIRQAAPKLDDAHVIDFLNTINRLDTITNAATHGNTILVDMKDSDSDLAKTITAVKAAQ
jgi:regulator of protease activity HflC (stomatin/prohibitin superfamily)